MVTRRASRTAAVLLAATTALFLLGVALEPTEHHEEERTVLGIDPESTGAVAVAALTSIALAAGLWFATSRTIAATTAVVGFGFAVLDFLEVAHQLDESKAGLAALAAVVAVGHLTTATAAALALS